MKTKLYHWFAVLSSLAFSCQLSIASAQGTAFSYQGDLENGGAAVNGLYDFQLKLFTDPFGATQSGPTVTSNAVPVTNGLFIVSPDFGYGIWDGTNYWLQIGVRSNGVGSYSDLAQANVTPGQNNGLIASFGNADNFVVQITNDGSIYAKAFNLTSDRNAKQSFTVLDHQTVLAKVAAMPVTEWNYKDDKADKKHIGPVAQDFEAAFGLNGGDSKHISVVDETGVALAAIQGLNEKLDEKDAEIAQLKAKAAEVDQLKQRLDKLEQLLSQKTKGQ
ncbi:MAG TPA: tail fiber domain-containing protein [Verrucomicrobiae bacterium]|jgi:hypothetical protein|nr:tail fiber domain-containing protein [Verrucomicrobiae bacterium]